MRDKAREARDKIERGVDPMAERKAARAALAAAAHKSLIFAEAANKYLDAKLDAYRNEKHSYQWRTTLEQLAFPVLGKLPVSSITVRDVLQVLHPIWTHRTETASLLRGRIEAVLSWATVSGHRAGDNPARWEGNLKELLPAPSKVKAKGNQPALSFDDAPRWFSAIQQREGFGPRALEFAALTAARSGEVRGAIWSEIDLDRALWIVPAERMKMGKEHRVPLTDPALALLKALPKLDGTDLVFPSSRGGQQSDITRSATMRRLHEADISADGPGCLDRVSKRPAVPHGLRSTFRDWVAEQTDFPGDMAEVALAHKVGNVVEAAYRRGDMVEKRRVMMDVWATFLASVVMHLEESRDA